MYPLIIRHPVFQFSSASFIKSGVLSLILAGSVLLSDLISSGFIICLSTFADFHVSSNSSWEITWTVLILIGFVDSMPRMGPVVNIGTRSNMGKFFKGDNLNIFFSFFLKLGEKIPVNTLN